MKTLLIGLGSLNADDQVGWLIIDELQRLKSDIDVTLFKSKSNGSDWFHEIKDHQQIVFVDALLSEQPIDTEQPIDKIDELSLDEICQIPNKFKSSTHSISLSDSILMAQNLDLLKLLKVPIRIFGIPIGHSRLLESISNEILSLLSTNQR